MTDKDFKNIEDIKRILKYILPKVTRIYAVILNLRALTTLKI